MDQFVNNPNPAFVKMQNVYQNLTEDISFGGYNSEELRELIKIFNNEVTTSKVKNTWKALFRNFVYSYIEITKDNQKLNEEVMRLKQEKASSIDQPVGNRPLSYANAIGSKAKENVLFVKKKNLRDDQTKVMSELTKRLEDSGQRARVTKFKQQRNGTLVFTKDEEDVKVIEDAVRKSTKIEARKPARRIPSILIKEIDRNWNEERIAEEIYECNQPISKDSFKVLRIIRNLKYKTNRALVNFTIEDTKRILDQGYVQIDYMCCPVEKWFKLIQCFNCLRFGHRCSDTDGNENCWNYARCSHCGESGHKNVDCPNKEDESKVKCCNCNEKHKGDDIKCKKRKSYLDRVKSESDF